MALTLYDHPLSGNCHKVRLLAGFAGLGVKLIFVDVLGRANRSEVFAALNPLQQVPVLIDGEDVVWDSHAILIHLAGRYTPAWMPPPGGILFAQVMQWIALSTNEIGNSLQPMRLYHLIGPSEAAHHMGIGKGSFDVEGCRRRCARTLAVLESRLSSNDWLVGLEPSIADIACFPYVSLAYQGNIDLAIYPGVARWVENFKALPDFTEMEGISRASAA